MRMILISMSISHFCHFFLASTDERELVPYRGRARLPRDLNAQPEASGLSTLCGWRRQFARRAGRWVSPVFEVRLGARSGPAN